MSHEPESHQDDALEHSLAHTAKVINATSLAAMIAELVEMRVHWSCGWSRFETDPGSMTHPFHGSVGSPQSMNRVSYRSDESVSDALGHALASYKERGLVILGPDWRKVDPRKDGIALGDAVARTTYDMALPIEVRGNHPKRIAVLIIIKHTDLIQDEIWTMLENGGCDLLRGEAVTDLEYLSPPSPAESGSTESEAGA